MYGSVSRASTSARGDLPLDDYSSSMRERLVRYSTSCSYAGASRSTGCVHSETRIPPSSAAATPMRERSFSLNVNAETGHVTSIKIERRTGYQVLDVAALKALINWRF